MRGHPRMEFLGRQRNPVLVRLPKENLIIALIQRAASSSMAIALRKYGSAITPEEAHNFKNNKGDRVVMWLRDPWDRLAATRNLFSGRFPTDQEFVDTILRRNNVHWRPQMDLHKVSGVNVASEIYSFNDLKSTWKQELPTVKLGWEKRSKHSTWTEIASNVDAQSLSDLADYYAVDIEARAAL